jgi:hypothetical protein
MALSVQVVSFARGGFTVAWRTNHVVVDGCALSSLVTAWSEFTRLGGTLPAAARPNHGRSVFRPRAPPSYSTSLDDAFTPLDARRQVNVLRADQSSIHRFYYIEASDVARLREAASRGGERATRVQRSRPTSGRRSQGVVGTDDSSCRMGWWVDVIRISSPTNIHTYTSIYFDNTSWFYYSRSCSSVYPLSKFTLKLMFIIFR